MAWELARFPTARSVSYTIDGDAPAVVIERPLSRLRLSLVGAHVMSFETWNNSAWREHLWMSPLARPTPGKAMRGGIPICWPWFGPHATDTSLPQHGFARTALWQVVDATTTATHTTLRLDLPGLDSANFRGASGEAESVALTVTINDEPKLSLELAVSARTNLVFSAVFHTYFRVGDVRRVQVEGFERARYRDRADGNTWKTLAGPFDFTREVNAHFPEQSARQTIVDPAGSRRIAIGTTGAKGTTVWHPGPDAPQKFAEIPATIAHHFVCVENGNLPENPVRLTAGATHTMSAAYQFDIAP
jgi:glucose-6-phosphate 1-epimerase